jgi:hypothetical protein
MKIVLTDLTVNMSNLIYKNFYFETPFLDEEGQPIDPICLRNETLMRDYPSVFQKIGEIKTCPSGKPRFSFEQARKVIELLEEYSWRDADI